MELINGQLVEYVTVNETANGDIVVGIGVAKNSEREVRISTKDVTIFLKNTKNINVDNCIQSTVLTNKSLNEGCWIFTVKKEEFDFSEKLVDKEDTVDVVSSGESLKKKRRSSN